MRTATRTGHVAAGVHSIRYRGYVSHSLPSPRGLVVDSEDERCLVLVQANGHRRKLGKSHGGWSPQREGIAIQESGHYYLIPYDGGHNQTIFRGDIPYQMRCCDTGMVLNRDNSFLYAPFNGCTPYIFWREGGLHAVVDDGIVLGSYEKKNWIHVKVTGETNTIYTEKRHYESGISSCGFVWAHCDGEVHMYHWDGRDPATTKLAGCGGCCQGIVANFKDKIVIYPFGGGELVLWEGPYDKWRGSNDIGLFFETDGGLFLLPYDGRQPRPLWRGPFRDLLPLDNSLLIRNQGEVIMIPLNAA